MESTDRRVYECDRCGYRCNFRQNLRRHRKTHEAKNVHCEHCPYTCRLPQHLRRHLRLVHSFDPDQATGPLFVCATCPFATGSAKAMGAHCARLHNDRKPWRCSRCEYRARSRCIIRYHEEQVHERKRPFTCETCGLAVVSRRVLAIHRIVHSTDPTPYRCDRCKYATRFLSNLTKHMIVHTDAKPFECSDCDIRFARKANLKSHLNKAHRRCESLPNTADVNTPPEEFIPESGCAPAVPLEAHDVNECSNGLWRTPDDQTENIDGEDIDAVVAQIYCGEVSENLHSDVYNNDTAEWLKLSSHEVMSDCGEEMKSESLATEMSTLLLAVPTSCNDTDYVSSMSEDSFNSEVEKLAPNCEHRDECVQAEDFPSVNSGGDFCLRCCDGDCLLHCLLAL